MQPQASPLPQAGMFNKNKHLYIAAITIVVAFVVIMLYALSQNLIKVPSFLITQPTNPRQLYSNYLKLANSTTSYTINYSMNVPALNAILPLLGVQSNGAEPGELLVSRSGEQNKYVFSAGTLAIAQYNLGNNINVTCTSYSTGEEPSCTYSSINGEIGAISSGFTYKNLTAANNVADQINVTYLGRERVIGRECDSFRTVVNANEVSALINQSSSSSNHGSSVIPSNGSIVTDVCVDTQTGLPLILNVTETYYSTLLSKTKTVQIFSLNATGFSTKVPSQEFTIPSSFAITNSTIECTDNSISFSFISLRNATNSTIRVSALPYIYSYFGNLSLSNVNGQNSMQSYNSTVSLGGNLVIGREYTVNATFKKQLSKSSNYTTIINSSICIDGYCSGSQYCNIPYSLTNSLTNYNYSAGIYINPISVTVNNQTGYAYVYNQGIYNYSKGKYANSSITIINGTEAIKTIPLSSNYSSDGVSVIAGAGDYVYLLAAGALTNNQQYYLLPIKGLNDSLLPTKLPPGNVSAVAVAENGTMYIGYNNGLVYEHLEGDTWLLPQISSNLSLVYSMAYNPSNGYLLILGNAAGYNVSSNACSSTSNISDYCIAILKGDKPLNYIPVPLAPVGYGSIIPANYNYSYVDGQDYTLSRTLNGGYTFDYGNYSIAIINGSSLETMVNIKNRFGSFIGGGPENNLYISNYYNNTIDVLHGLSITAMPSVNSVYDLSVDYNGTIYVYNNTFNTYLLNGKGVSGTIHNIIGSVSSRTLAFDRANGYVYIVYNGIVYVIKGTTVIKTLNLEGDRDINQALSFPVNLGRY